MNIYVYKNLPTTRTLSKRFMLINTMTDKCWLHIENSSLYSLIETMDSPDVLFIGAPHAILKIYRGYPYTMLVYSIGVDPIYF